MIRFKTLKLTNFMSYGAIPTIVHLDSPGTTLLLGEDLDSSNRRSNGVGKTTIFNALVYALYDRPLEDEMSKDGLVNHTNKKGMEVVIEFNKDNDEYEIVRQRKMKVGASGNTTTLYENGIDISQDSRNTNAEIERIIGMPYEMFVRIVAFSAFQTPFLNLPVRHPTLPNQTDFIEELFDLKTLSLKADALKEEIKDTNGALEGHLEKNEILKGEHERHKKQLETAQKRAVAWEQSRVLEIEDVKHKIEKLEGVDVDDQRQIYEHIQEMKTKKDEAHADWKMKTGQVEEHNKSIRILTTELEHLERGECPRCHQKYRDANLPAIHLGLENEKLDLNVNSKYEEAYKAEYDSRVFELNRLQKTFQFKTLEELLNSKNRLEQLREKLGELELAVNPHTEPLLELEAVKLDEVEMVQINELNHTLEHQQFLLKLLTKKDSFVRKALVNKNIPFLNKRLKKYLTDLELPHHVEFTHEMTASISKLGYEMEFGNLSRGQKASVNLALSFAFRDVLQSMHDFVNIYALDEVLDVGLDEVGVQAAARMLKRKARDEKLALYIISHKGEIDGAFDRKMIVQMSEGFSSIRYEDG